VRRSRGLSRWSVPREVSPRWRGHRLRVAVFRPNKTNLSLGTSRNRTLNNGPSPHYRHSDGPRLPILRPHPSRRPSDTHDKVETETSRRLGISFSFHPHPCQDYSRIRSEHWLGLPRCASVLRAVQNNSEPGSPSSVTSYHSSCRYALCGFESPSRRQRSPTGGCPYGRRAAGRIPLVH